MPPYDVRELAWTVARGREEEARQTRPHAAVRAKIAPTVTAVTVSLLSRW